MSLRSIVYRLLSRPATSGSFIAELDGLRFIAISLVILHHNHYVLRDSLPSYSVHGIVWDAYRNLAAAGGLGVPLFFIISGIVLSLPFARQSLQGGRRVSIGAYFWRRLRRLEPPYLINLTLLFGLMIISGGSEVFWERVPAYLASVFYLHNTIYNAWSDINFVAWSLEVEAQFYVIAPLLCLCFLLRNRLAAYVSMMLVLSATSAATLDADFRLTNSIISLGQYFVAGILIADLMITERLYGKMGRIIYDILALVFFVFAVMSDIGYPFTEVRAFGVVPLLLFFLCMFRGHFILRMMRWRLIYTIGGMCYSIYLYHFWIIQLPVRAFDLSDEAMTIVQVLVFDAAMFMLVFLVSSVLFVLFERPFMSRVGRAT